MDTTFNNLVGDFGMLDCFTWLGYIVLHRPSLWHVFLRLKVCKSGAVLMVKRDNFAAFLFLYPP